MSIKTLNSTIVYQNSWMTVREDQIERESGATGIYGVVDKPDCAVIIAIDGARIHLVQQYRYSVGCRYWELPQGAWESNPEADPLELAKGELQEETGLIAGNMTYVGQQLIAYGFLNQTCHIYLATELSQSARNLDVEEEDLITKSFSIEEFETMIIEGEIQDIVTTGAWGLAKLKGLIHHVTNK
ncbi:ADP-ribose pyrophosphatase [Vibrio sp. 10N.286.49.C2]|uniref:NUDIX domain-containing protein n=1 Tax=unclassified Vibrio TaxID=2614977 RepID=UPI000C83D0F6|nr:MULTISPECIES: NUDIX hydrolase [unclassified Vibrio]PMH30316.1 ADP-ribose pyrophosphatase [Vibrio sp. 10N.286.49.C2]PMH50863.1 ADP-ribose pyrophosphatase [Vibrio sp. 10N.286.49.B1]PMH80566.1 ADP-ribose pyrophosphatase [Vibrio sp. 10N.286.48.B7]